MCSEIQGDQHLESRVCSVIQGDNNLLRPLFKCHFCRYQLEGIQVYDGGWQVALIGAYSSTYVGGYDSNGSL